MPFDVNDFHNGGNGGGGNDPRHDFVVIKHLGSEILGLLNALADAVGQCRYCCVMAIYIEILQRHYDNSEDPEEFNQRLKDMQECLNAYKVMAAKNPPGSQKKS